MEPLKIEELEQILSFLQESYPYNLIKRIEEILRHMKENQKNERMRMLLHLKNNYPDLLKGIRGSEND